VAKLCQSGDTRLPVQGRGAIHVLTVELLGPLRVSVHAEPVELPAGRLRAVLAVLAMSAGRTVPTDRLATAVWGTDLHGDPRANGRTSVMRLRRALGLPRGS
jgi:DNA-binding SARP family transcriptional activator